MCWQNKSAQFFECHIDMCSLNKQSTFLSQITYSREWAIQILSHELTTCYFLQRPHGAMAMFSYQDVFTIPPLLILTIGSTVLHMHWPQCHLMSEAVMNKNFYDSNWSQGCRHKLQDSLFRSFLILLVYLEKERGYNIQEKMKQPYFVHLRRQTLVLFLIQKTLQLFCLNDNSVTTEILWFKWRKQSKNIFVFSWYH